jgi:GxxExxY protein
MRREDWLSNQIIGAAIEVHRHLGPGLLESVYETCLVHELAMREISLERQKAIAVNYKDVVLDCGFRVDLLVEGQVIVELKAVDALTAVHEAQLLTYLKLSDCRLGLLINFNVLLLKDGLKRLVLNY